MMVTSDPLPVTSRQSSRRSPLTIVPHTKAVLQKACPRSAIQQARQKIMTFHYYWVEELKDVVDVVGDVPLVERVKRKFLGSQQQELVTLEAPYENGRSTLCGRTLISSHYHFRCPDDTQLPDFSIYAALAKRCGKTPRYCEHGHNLTLL